MNSTPDTQVDMSNKDALKEAMNEVLKEALQVVFEKNVQGDAKLHRSVTILRKDYRELCIPEGANVFFPLLNKTLQNAFTTIPLGKQVRKFSHATISFGSQGGCVCVNPGQTDDEIRIVKVYTPD